MYMRRTDSFQLLRRCRDGSLVLSPSTVGNDVENASSSSHQAFQPFATNATLERLTTSMIVYNQPYASTSMMDWACVALEVTDPHLDGRIFIEIQH